MQAPRAKGAHGCVVLVLCVFGHRASPEPGLALGVLAGVREPRPGQGRGTAAPNPAAAWDRSLIDTAAPITDMSHGEFV